jgi:hypothetical protein
LTEIRPPAGVRGRAIRVTIRGTGFVPAETRIADLPGIRVDLGPITNPTLIEATFTIDADAAVGPRDVAIATPNGTSGARRFTVGDPFPDLSMNISRIDKFGVGFDERYTVTVRNEGAAAAGAMTVGATLPQGLTFVSGLGGGWACSGSGSAVTCVSAGPLGPHSATSFALDVAVGSAAAPEALVVFSVSAAEDLNPSNDITENRTPVAPVPGVEFSLTQLAAGKQGTVGISLKEVFPHDVAGTLTLTFTSNAAVPGDDPAIQFETGGRRVEFVIPANTLHAIFGRAEGSRPIGFQSGTISGTVGFTARLQAGAVSTEHSPAAGEMLTISRQAPFIHDIRTTTDNGEFSVLVTLWSTIREVTHVRLAFSGAVRPSCGAVPGCVVSGSTIQIEVGPTFRDWFASDNTFGSLATLRLPLVIRGAGLGRVFVTLLNSVGVSNSTSVLLPH